MLNRLNEIFDQAFRYDNSASDNESSTTQGNGYHTGQKLRWPTYVSKPPQQRAGKPIASQPKQNQTIQDSITPTKMENWSSVVQKSSEFEDTTQQITSQKLQDAVIWSEILGKPLCKRRKRRLER